MAVRMKDVAELAGVSVATVSYVLARRTDVAISPTTRERVLSAARRLNYRYNALAADLRRGRTPIVGVQIYSLGVQTLAAMIAALEDRLRAAGMHPLLCHVTDESAEQMFHKECRNRRVSGIVLTAPPLCGRCRYLRDLMEEGSVVVSSEPIPDLAVPFVSIDRANGVETAVRHLLSLGHRRFAAVTGWGARGRHDLSAGFRSALASVGLSFEPDRLFQVESNASYYEAGDRAVERLIGLHLPPTAILTTDDEIAIGVMRSLQRRGLRVPDDIAVIGWDNIPAASYAEVPLTTLTYPTREQGTRLAELFLEGLQNPQHIAGRQVRLPLQLVVRASCGAFSGERTAAA